MGKSDKSGPVATWTITTFYQDLPRCGEDNRYILNHVAAYYILHLCGREIPSYRSQSSAFSCRCRVLLRMWSLSFDYLLMRRQRQSNLRKHSRMRRSGPPKQNKRGDSSVNPTKPPIRICLPRGSQMISGLRSPDGTLLPLGYFADRLVKTSLTLAFWQPRLSSRLRSARN